MRPRQSARPAMTTVEAAIVCPVVLLLVIGLMVGVQGIYVYHQTAHLARVAARYASVHGTQWAQDTGNSAATPQDIYNNAILPQVASLDLSRLSYSVTYNTSNQPSNTTVVNGNIIATRNTVSVTVTYRWQPAVYFLNQTLSSTSVMPMMN
jgi:Flp pilus assembly protein TadG